MPRNANVAQSDRTTFCRLGRFPVPKYSPISGRDAIVGHIFRYIFHRDVVDHNHHTQNKPMQCDLMPNLIRICHKMKKRNMSRLNHWNFRLGKQDREQCHVIRHSFSNHGNHGEQTTRDISDVFTVKFRTNAQHVYFFKG